MSVIKTVYNFEDGRVGTLTKSDRIYKTIEHEEEVEVEDKNSLGVVIGTHKETRKTFEDIYYNVRKIGTDEVYSEAIDVVHYDYEEVTEAEMEAQYGSNK